MVRSPTTLIIARNGNADHIAANSANVCVFLAAIYEMHSLHPLRCEVVGTLWPQHITRYMHVLSHPFFLCLLCLLTNYLKFEVAFSLLKLYIGLKLLKL